MPRLVDHEQRRQELAAAVWAVMATEGLEAVTMRRVAQEAGWSTGVLSHYFADRAELLIFAYELSCRQTSERLRGFGRRQPGLAGLREAITEILPLDRRRRTEIRIWIAFTALSAHNDAMLRARAKLERQWRSFLERAIAAAQVAGDLDAGLCPEFAAAGIHLLIDGLSIQGVFEPNRLSAAQQLAQLDAHLDRLRGSGVLAAAGQATAS